MKHIETKSAAEKDARKKYANAEEGFAEAGDELAAKVAELLALRKKMDDDELRKSELMGDIMEAMKTATALRDKGGRVIATWSAASSKSTVDYKGLMKHLGATKEDVEKFTTVKQGARTFELVEDPSECKEAVSRILERMKGEE